MLALRAKHNFIVAAIGAAKHHARLILVILRIRVRGGARILERHGSRSGHSASPIGVPASVAWCSRERVWSLAEAVEIVDSAARTSAVRP